MIVKKYVVWQLLLTFTLSGDSDTVFKSCFIIILLKPANILSTKPLRTTVVVALENINDILSTILEVDVTDKWTSYCHLYSVGTCIWYSNRFDFFINAIHDKYKYQQ